MILSAMRPGIIRQFVIVALRNHREHLVKALKVGISPIAGEPQPVVRKPDGLSRGLELPAGDRLAASG